VIPLELHNAVLAMDDEKRSVRRMPSGTVVCPTCYTTMRTPAGWNIDVSGVDADEVKRVAIALLQETSNASSGDVVHGDKYVVEGSAMAVGNGATGTVLSDWNTFAESADLAELTKQLAYIRSRPDVNDLEQAALVGSFAGAEQAIRSNDGASALAWFRKAGKAGLKFASDVGTAVVTEAIKAAMGLR
jgi:hypothetical protein